MPSQSDDELTRIAFSLYENRGVYALLVGSGLSRAAQVPTGWEITLDLIRRVALVQGEPAQTDWASWYRENTGHEPDYSEVVGKLGLSQEERRAILHSYIEPSSLDRQEGKKTPTQAHYAIADLVQSGYIRVIVTTNFDRLLETALRDRGTEPTVVASVDALKGAEPITHTSCYLLKLHGDYKDARILNTNAELSNYPPEYNTILDRILDEFGLLVSGWSAEWDHALSAALARTPNRRYTTFWTVRGSPGSAAADLIHHRRARLISVADANAFFSTIRDRVQTLAETHQRNPQTVELLVNTTKQFISKPEHRIQLDELLTAEINSFLENLESSSLSTRVYSDTKEFTRQVNTYEAAIEPLARMSGVLGRWGDDTEFNTMLAIVRTTLLYAERERSGRIPLVKLRSYTSVLLVATYGLGLVRAHRWSTLRRFLLEPIEGGDGSASKPVVEKLLHFCWDGGDRDTWQTYEGLDRRRTPLSDHLCDILENWATSFTGIVPDFVELYELWEVLGSLIYSERYTADQIQAAMAERTGRGYLRVPVGRSIWHTPICNRIVERLKSEEFKSSLLRANYGNGEADFIDLAIANFEVMADRAGWG